MKKNKKIGAEGASARITLAKSFKESGNMVIAVNEIYLVAPLTVTFDVNDGSSPQTRDSSSILLFFLLMSASGTALVILYKKRHVCKHLKK